MEYGAGVLSCAIDNSLENSSNQLAQGLIEEACNSIQKTVELSIGQAREDDNPCERVEQAEAIQDLIQGEAGIQEAGD